jgi:hypothetical protein
MQKLIIKRSEWLRGEGSDCSYLYRSSDGKRCCLGFLGNQVCGLTDDEMAGNAMPSCLPRASWLPQMLKREERRNGDGHFLYDAIIDAPITTSLAHINDSQMVSEEKREKEVSQLMRELDIEVEFID